MGRFKYVGEAQCLFRLVVWGSVARVLVLLVLHKLLVCMNSCYVDKCRNVKRHYSIDWVSSVCCWHAHFQIFMGCASVIIMFCQSSPSFCAIFSSFMHTSACPYNLDSPASHPGTLNTTLFLWASWRLSFSLSNSGLQPEVVACCLINQMLSTNKLLWVPNVECKVKLIWSPHLDTIT